MKLKGRNHRSTCPNLLVALYQQLKLVHDIFSLHSLNNASTERRCTHTAESVGKDLRRKYSRKKRLLTGKIKGLGAIAHLSNSPEELNLDIGTLDWVTVCCVIYILFHNRVKMGIILDRIWRLKCK